MNKTGWIVGRAIIGLALACAVKGWTRLSHEEPLLSFLLVALSVIITSLAFLWGGAVVGSGVLVLALILLLRPLGPLHGGE